MDARPSRRNKAAFSNVSGVVWTGPYFRSKGRSIKCTTMLLLLIASSPCIPLQGNIIRRLLCKLPSDFVDEFPFLVTV